MTPLLPHTLWPCLSLSWSAEYYQWVLIAAFSATKVGSQASKVGGLLDIGFEQMDTDGCKYTTCPLEPSKKQTYRYNLEVGTQFPAVSDN